MVNDREILLLKFEKKMDRLDIAEYYGISESASRQRFSRALKNCRKLIGMKKHLSLDELSIYMSHFHKREGYTK